MASRFNVVHPLSPLTANEIRNASRLLRAKYGVGTQLRFKTITLLEPEKPQVVDYLRAEASGGILPQIDRRAFANYYRLNNGSFVEAVVNLTKGLVEVDKALGPRMHGPGDEEELREIEKLVLADAKVLEEIAKLKVDLSLVIVEPWIYGSDGIDDERRQFQCYLFLRHPNNPEEMDSCHYGLPLPISPVVDTLANCVTRIDILPTGKDNTLKETTEYPIPPSNEYLPELQDLRRDLKPINIIQPEGVSFKVLEDSESGRTIEWQKWRFRLGFNAREGTVLYNVSYDNRPVFYRVSLSEMNIPYADPRPPYHKKAAFDLGDVGAGVAANNLELGCDCLGTIYYHSSVIADSQGEPVARPNCVCIHEQDAGIGWKHTNYRTGRAVVTRSRELVLQTILTVSNYEYILAFILNQAGDLTYEARATGILSTQYIERDVDVDFGTVVHPGVLAACHQHFFSLRIEPMIDGLDNTLLCEETAAMPRSQLNPHGTGYCVTSAPITTSGGYDLDVTKNRVFKIVNQKVRNPVNHKPVGYKIMVPDFQKMLADEDSWHRRRAEFADHNIYVTKYRPQELYSGGQYTNQSAGGHGVRSWASRSDPVEDSDIVVWVQFGINHIPRIEDFPVMPCEKITVMLRPVNFFTKNPALDVPPSLQAVNKSALATQVDQCCSKPASSSLAEMERVSKL